jgi:hypothetical protein
MSFKGRRVWSVDKQCKYQGGHNVNNVFLDLNYDLALGLIDVDFYIQETLQSVQKLLLSV